MIRPLISSRGIGTGTRAGAAWPGVKIVHSLDEAMQPLAGVPQVCVIGGSDVFALALPRAASVYLTRVHGIVPGDTFFPLGDIADWRETERVEHPADERHRYAMSFVTLVRE